MRQTKLLIFFFAIFILLTSCAHIEAAPDPAIPESGFSSPAAETSPSNLPDSMSPDVPTEDDSHPPREGMVRSRLTNEWITEEAANIRPIALIVPNENNAIPHYNLSRASILYEANVEGRMTRLMAVFEDWLKLEKTGNVRSLRTYYAYWAFEWDAFLVHLGGPFFINELIAEPGTENIDGLLTSDSAAFIRTTDRSSPHNAYTDGPRLASTISRKGYSLNYRDLTDSEHFRFASKKEPNTLNQYDQDAKSALYIDMSGCYPLTRCYFEYNEDDGLYYRSQHLSGGTDGPHIDAATGEQLSFKNILIQYVKCDDLGEGYLAFQCHDTTSDGWFFTNGRGIHVNWKKESNYGATKFYDDNGREIILNTGKTMICVVEEGDKFTFR